VDASKASGRTLQKRLGIRAPAATVFQALSDAVELSRWFPTTAETDPRPGGAYRFRFESTDHPERSHTREGTFLDVLPNKRLSYTWHAPLGSPPGEGPAPETKVEFALTEKGGTTELVLTHSGFGYGPDWDRSFEGHSEGWAFFVTNLRSYLERGVDARTPAPGESVESEPGESVESDSGGG
jgi:uncharacterized protein YndB with AHSA1/START domain